MRSGSCAAPVAHDPSAWFPSPIDGVSGWRLAEVRTLADLSRVLRGLRRRHARRRGTSELTYRELAAKTGWSHGIIGEYLSGRVLPPTDRFDVLIGLLGATPAEQGALATARDQVEENRRQALPAPVPRQLPMDVYGFTGRTEQLATLHALLAPGERRTAVISAVAGTAGAGKTALAVHWAHQVAKRFPDGQLYLDLRGYDPERPVPAADALAGFLRSLGVDGQDIPDDLSERAARYRTLVAGRRLLIVLDNARGADHVRPLLPGSPSCFVVVTSREDLAGLVARDGARRIELDMLSTPEAIALLRALIGERVDKSPSQAAELAENCARLPLALRIAAELAVARPGVALAELVAGLRDEQRRLDLLDAAGDPRTAVRAVFSWSYRQLSADAARLFDLLGLHPGRDIDAYAAAALAGAGLGRARELVEELARGHLLESAGPGRYTMHDLLRAFAVENATDPHAALTRLLNYYRYTAASAAGVLFPYERGRPEPDVPGSPVPPVDEVVAWLDRERPNLVAVADYAARHGWPGHCVDLSRALWRHFEVGCHYQEALAVHTSAARAALAAGEGRAAALANLGGIHWWLGDFRQAGERFRQSLAAARETGDLEGEARALGRLGVVAERLGELPSALGYLGDALALCRRTGNRHGTGTQLINIGALYRRLGRYEDAAEHQLEAADVFAEVGDLRLRGYALGNLGALYGLLGRHEGALTHLEQALANCRESGDPGGEGSALAAMGAVYLRLGRHPEALDHLRRALAGSRETGDRSLETETLNTLGETLRAMGQPDSALARHRAAHALTEETGDQYEHARALAGIAHVLHDSGHTRQARENWRVAADIYRRLGVPETQRIEILLSE
ncbi:ATP-binding protein [Acrocarpospora pleiomorpha]|uniref:ATP-binding protein n=1 Tax=Acrocarpospora pleiomorpha TaxID=90975 RepID=UPI0012D2AFB4|nr:tetratricopeptide repeat protein [Acrocarpospora pleiomorpha]